LPFVALGLGLSYSSFTPGNESVLLIKGARIINKEVDMTPEQKEAFQTCGPPLDDSGESGVCSQPLTLDPEKNKLSGFNFDLVAAAGFDVLFSEHWGMTLEGRYNLVRAFDPAGYEIDFISDPVAYNLEDDPAQPARSIYKDTFPVKPTYHSLGAFIGVLAYF
jgi:hypothetical protein